MPTLLPAAYETQFMTFFFVLLRVAAAVFTMPVLGAQSVSRPVQVGIAFWIAVLLVSSYIGLGGEGGGVAVPPSTKVYHGVVDFALAGAGELLIGFGLGFIFQILFGAIGLAGELIGKEAGFSAASVFDPISGEDNLLLAQIKIWFATMFFLILGGPEMVIQAIADSFRVIGPGEGVSIAKLGEAGYRTLIYDESRHYALMSILFIVGLRIAMPMIGAMLLISLAEAFIARTAPQLNIMSVGFAVRMSMALFILGSIFVYFAAVLKPHLRMYPAFSKAFLGWLAPS